MCVRLVSLSTAMADVQGVAGELPSKSGLQRAGGMDASAEVPSEIDWLAFSPPPTPPVLADPGDSRATHQIPREEEAVVEPGGASAASRPARDRRREKGRGRDRGRGRADAMHLNRQQKSKKGKQKSRAEVFHCDICDVSTTGREPFTAHLKGKLHKTKERQANYTAVNNERSRLYEAPSPEMPLDKDDWRFTPPVDEIQPSRVPNTAPSRFADVVPPPEARDAERDLSREREKSSPTASVAPSSRGPPAPDKPSQEGASKDRRRADCVGASPRDANDTRRSERSHSAPSGARPCADPPAERAVAKAVTPARTEAGGATRSDGSIRASATGGTPPREERAGRAEASKRAEVGVGVTEGGSGVAQKRKLPEEEKRDSAAVRQGNLRPRLEAVESRRGEGAGVRSGAVVAAATGRSNGVGAAPGPGPMIRSVPVAVPKGGYKSGGPDTCGSVSVGDGRSCAHDQARLIPTSYLEETMKISEWRELRCFVFEKGNAVDKLAFKLLQEIILSPVMGVRFDALRPFSRAMLKSVGKQYFQDSFGPYARFTDYPDLLRFREPRFSQGDPEWQKSKSVEEQAVCLVMDNIMYSFNTGEDCENVVNADMSTFPTRGSFGVRSGQHSSAAIMRDGGRAPRYEDSVGQDVLFNRLLEHSFAKARARGH